METVVVAIRQFASLGIANRHGGLKPAGHGIGQIRPQVARADGDHQSLTFARLEPIAIDAAGHDLSVHDGRQRDVHLRFGRARVWGSWGLGGRLAARRLSARLCLWFAKLGQLSDVKDQGIRQPVGRRQSQFPLAGLGVRGDRDTAR